MKINRYKTAFFISISILLLCTKLVAQTSSSELMLDSTLNKDFETFDIQWLEENATSQTPSGKYINYRYTKLDSNSYVLIGGQKNSIYYFYYFDKSYYSIDKSYYSSGKIREKGKRFNNRSVNSRVGKWYSFNEDGDLVKIEDYDRHFAFTFDDAIQYCLDHNIPLEKGAAPRLKSSSATTINRRYLPTQDSAVYTIRYFKDKNSIEFITITLDGNTGEELSREEGQMKGA